MHVLEHAEPNPAKTIHSVFSMHRKEILGAVDEAWLKKGSPAVGDPGAYVVPMGRAIGTSGETSTKVIVRPGTSQVIIAYLVKWRGFICCVQGVGREILSRLKL